MRPALECSSFRRKNLEQLGERQQKLPPWDTREDSLWVGQEKREKKSPLFLGRRQTTVLDPDALGGVEMLRKFYFQDQGTQRLPKTEEKTRKRDQHPILSTGSQAWSFKCQKSATGRGIKTLRDPI